jgi:hypothetical protein
MNVEREKVARWMIANGLATGHGDTIEDLLGEASWQIAELRSKIEKMGSDLGNHPETKPNGPPPTRA